jgi:membrane protease YdiL (CAAX protease family)
MPIDHEEIPTAANAAPARQKQLASWWHFAGYLAIMAILTRAGFISQRMASSASSATPGQLMDHSQAIRSYFISIGANLGLTYYIWAGVHWHGGTLHDLTGGRWKTWKSVAIDVAIAIPFWLVWEAAAWAVISLLALLRPDNASSVAGMLPKSPLEVILWIAVSVVAGFCEEIQSRGYLQKQFHALTGSIVVAILAQAAIFGLIHSYQGWQKVIVIAALGLLYGILAAWRRNLRANMLAHAWSDVWNGWLRMLIWP